jgi:hypothetical protein
LRAHLPRLRDIRAFVCELERRVGVQFDRAASHVRTNIADAEAVLRAWLEEH